MYFILSGSSGSGKNTIINDMIKSNNDIALLPTFTTREKRKNETNGNPYFFFSVEEFQDKIKNNEMVEHELIHNNFYGTSRSLLTKYLKEGKKLVKDIGVLGTFNLAEKLKSVTPVVKIFLTTSGKKECKKRLANRGETQIKLRLKRYNFEQKFKNKYDYIILNMDKQKTLNIMEVIVKIGDDYKQIIPTKEPKKINMKKVKKYCRKFLLGRIFRPIKVTIKDGNMYALNGIEKLIASIVVDRTLAKKFVEKSKIKMINNEQYNEYLKLFKK